MMDRTPLKKLYRRRFLRYAESGDVGAISMSEN
jgi:hypothetical protein